MRVPGGAIRDGMATQRRANQPAQPDSTPAGRSCTTAWWGEPERSSSPPVRHRFSGRPAASVRQGLRECLPTPAGHGRHPPGRRAASRPCTGARIAMPSKRFSNCGRTRVVASAAPVVVGTKLIAAPRPRRHVVHRHELQIRRLVCEFQGRPAHPAQSVDSHSCRHDRMPQ